MKRLLVTGADGFVGRWLVRAALGDGWQVTAVTGPGGAPPGAWLEPGAAMHVATFEADLTRAADCSRVTAAEPDAIVHLAAVSSGAQARQDPALAQQVNAGATIDLVLALAAAGQRPRFLFASTGEVYGAGHDGPIAENVVQPKPISPYAESKLLAEQGITTQCAAAGIAVLIARAFPHTGPGQDTRFVLPAFAARLRQAKLAGEREIAVGNLDVVRDFLDVRDVVRAYLLLLEHGEAGGVYNVASGIGRHLETCFRQLAAAIGVDAVPVRDASLVRPADIPVLIGDPARLEATTGWSPRIPFDRTLQDLVDAQAD